MRWVRTLSTLLGVGLIALSVTPVSLAALPGTNGKIAFDTNRAGTRMHVMNADGSGQTEAGGVAST